MFLYRQILQDSSLDFGGQHALAGFALRCRASVQWNFHVHEGERPVSKRHEIFAPDDSQQRQDLVVEHFPGADLLLNHVESGLFVVHVGCVA